MISEFYALTLGSFSIYRVEVVDGGPASAMKIFSKTPGLAPSKFEADQPVMLFEKTLLNGGIQDHLIWGEDAKQGGATTDPAVYLLDFQRSHRSSPILALAWDGEVLKNVALMASDQDKPELGVQLTDAILAVNGMHARKILRAIDAQPENSQFFLATNGRTLRRFSLERALAGQPV